MKSLSLPLIVAVSFFYIAIIAGWWFVVDADYRQVSSRDRILLDLIVPLGLGTIYLCAVVKWLGWWRPALSEDPRARPHWTAWVVGIGMACFIGLNFLTTDWTAIEPLHLGMLVLAGILVGFNEELLFRGINVVGLRQNGFGETSVWLLTSLIFALAHLSNGFFGTGLGGAIGQTVLVLVGASAYFLLRRVSGTILVPMMFHGLWDFSIFAQEASGAPAAQLLLAPLSLLVSILATGLMVLVLHRDKKDRVLAREAQ